VSTTAATLLDPADALMLDELAARSSNDLGRVVVIGDRRGGLSAAVLERGASEVLVHHDSVIVERALALAGSRSLQLGPELLSGASTVLLRLPLSLDELDEQAAAISAFAADDVIVVAGARLKYMTTAMNEVLSKHFGRIDVSLARQKSRVLVARHPLRSSPIEPRSQFHDDLGLWLCAAGGVFSGTRVDIGTRLLLSEISDALPEARAIADLGTGSGALAAALAMARPEATVIATDISSAAVLSAQATMLANGVSDRVSVRREPGLESAPDGSLDLVVLNPPFHLAGAVDASLAPALFAEAARALRDGGELWTVFNSSLGYRPALDRFVGSTGQIARNTKFTVTASRRRPTARKD